MTDIHKKLMILQRASIGENDAQAEEMMKKIEKAFAELEAENQRLERIISLAKLLLPLTGEPRLTGHITFRQALRHAVHDLKWEDEVQRGIRELEAERAESDKEG